MSAAAAEAAQRARNNALARRRTRLKAYGRWNPRVNAQPVRDHIADLSAAGIGWMRAAALAGLSTATVSNWLYGHNGYPPPRQIRTEHAAKMLAVTPHDTNLADRALVDSLTTIRRLQALAADGFPMVYLAARLDRDATNLSRVMRRTHVEAGTARAVARLHAELASTDPAKAGIGARNISYIRNWAAKKRWPTSAMWDGEIDNPDADPNAWALPDGQPEAPLRGQELLAEIDLMKRRTGDDDEKLAARFGLKLTTLRKIREREQARAKAVAP